MCEWKDHLITGQEFKISGLYPYFKEIINCPSQRVCWKCKLNDCKGLIFSYSADITIGRIRCLKCGWTTCKCKVEDWSGKIYFGIRTNKRIIKKVTEGQTFLTEVGQNQHFKIEDREFEGKIYQESKVILDKKPDAIDLILGSAKQHCKNCFISHTPLNRWCTRVNRRYKYRRKMNFTPKGSKDPVLSTLECYLSGKDTLMNFKSKQSKYETKMTEITLVQSSRFSDIEQRLETTEEIEKVRTGDKHNFKAMKEGSNYKP